MEVNVISTETIKPSSPTPNDLKNFKLSFIDQGIFKGYTSTIFFYPTNDDGRLELAQILSKLKKSLSETLTLFYPLSGRVKDEFFVDCNDKGVSFSEANVQSTMFEFLNEDQPKIEFLNQLLPRQPFVALRFEEYASDLVAIQVNIFKCGGIAIGVCMLHTIADATTTSIFLNTWAAITRGSDHQQIVGPELTTASMLFPAGELKSAVSDYSNFLISVFFKEKMCTTRRFLFDAKAIAELKEKSKSENVPCPTRYEAVSALIWKCMTSASRAISSSPNKPSFSTHAMDLRRRMGKPLSKFSTGNLIWFGNATYEDTTPAADDLVHKVRLCIDEVSMSGGFLTALQGDEDFLVKNKSTKLLLEAFQNHDDEAEAADNFVFTSWCNLGFNELDFGWGKPLWVGLFGGNDTEKSVTDFVVYMDSKFGGGGGGIEAWVRLEENKMAILENDPEFLKFALPNPSIYM